MPAPPSSVMAVAKADASSESLPVPPVTFWISAATASVLRMMELLPFAVRKFWMLFTLAKAASAIV